MRKPKRLDYKLTQYDRDRFIIEIGNRGVKLMYNTLDKCIEHQGGRGSTKRILPGIKNTVSDVKKLLTPYERYALNQAIRYIDEFVIKEVTTTLNHKILGELTITTLKGVKDTIKLGEFKEVHPFNRIVKTTLSENGRLGEILALEDGKELNSVPPLEFEYDLESKQMLIDVAQAYEIDTIFVDRGNESYNIIIPSLGHMFDLYPYTEHKTRVHAYTLQNVHIFSFEYNSSTRCINYLNRMNSRQFTGVIKTITDDEANIMLIAIQYIEQYI